MAASSSSAAAAGAASTAVAPMALDTSAGSESSAKRARKADTSDMALVYKPDRARLVYGALLRVNIRCCMGRTPKMPDTDPNTSCYYSTTWRHVGVSVQMKAIYCLGKRYSICDKDRGAVVGLCCRCGSTVPASANIQQVILLNTPADLFGNDEKGAPRFTEKMLREEHNLYMCHSCKFDPKPTTKEEELKHLRSLNLQLSNDLRNEVEVVPEAKKQASKAYDALVAQIRLDVKGSKDESFLISGPGGGVVGQVRGSAYTLVKSFSDDAMKRRKQLAFETPDAASHWWMITFLQNLTPRLERRDALRPPASTASTAVSQPSPPPGAHHNK